MSDVDRALSMSTRVGFTLDVDYALNDTFRVVQLTPPGPGCSLGKAAERDFRIVEGIDG